MLAMKRSKVLQLILPMGMFLLAAALMMNRFFHPPDSVAGLLFGSALGVMLVGIAVAAKGMFRRVRGASERP